MRSTYIAAKEKADSKGKVDVHKLKVAFDCLRNIGELELGLLQAPAFLPDACESRLSDRHARHPLHHVRTTCASVLNSRPARCVKKR